MVPFDFRILDDIKHNCIVKTYPDGSSEILFAEKAIFREKGWTNTSFDRDEIQRAEKVDVDRKLQSLQRAQRRAKVAVRDLALSNDFRYFVTLTLSSEKVDRYDVREITRRLNHWLDNHVRRHGLKYVIVPERHKDGAIHFHGLFNDALNVVDSGHRDKNGHKVYNLPAWDLGFTTAIELYGDRHAAVGYVCKYIGKQLQGGGKIGGRWYYSGGDLKRPQLTYCDVDYAELSGYNGAYEFVIDALGVRCGKLSAEGGKEDGNNQQPGRTSDNVQHQPGDVGRGGISGYRLQVPERGTAVSGNIANSARNGAFAADYGGSDEAYREADSGCGQ